ncbi:MAG: ABC transporter substrate-binding protein, partial [Corynebacterium sp.]|nr:ABC transporter substrate-binding protein [Corynebacterium sp.]
MSRISRKTGASLAATTLIAAIALAGCSSDSSDETTADTTAATGDEEGRGPITFAMGKNDTDKIIPVIDKWNEENPDEQVTLNELAGEADAQRETLVQSL